MLLVSQFSHLGPCVLPAAHNDEHLALHQLLAGRHSGGARTSDPAQVAEDADGRLEMGDREAPQ